MGADHPLVWCREQGAGRVFYTALGHTSEAYHDPDFLAHLRGGIKWAAGHSQGTRDTYGVGVRTATRLLEGDLARLRSAPEETRG
jgi:type 1 glutamine amidotransferase